MKVKITRARTPESDSTNARLAEGATSLLRPSVFEFKSDREIWQEFKKGSEAAFNYIYRKYAADLYNFGHQITPDCQHVQDCMQNLFIDLRRRREKLSDVTSIKAYLYRGLYHEVLRKMEKERRFKPMGEGLEDDRNAVKFFRIELSFEEKLINHEISEEARERLVKVLNSLTLKQRKALLLFYAEGFSYSEVAETMSLKNSKSARKLIYRAIAAARECGAANAAHLSTLGR